MRGLFSFLSFVLLLTLSGCSDTTLKPSNSLDRRPNFASKDICTAKLEFNEAETLPDEEGQYKLIIIGKKDIKKQKVQIAFEYDKKCVAVEWNNTEFMIEKNQNHEVEFKTKTQNKPIFGNTVIRCHVQSSRGQIINTCELKLLVRLFRVRSSEGREFTNLPPSTFFTNFNFKVPIEYKKPIKTNIISKLPKGFKMIMDYPVLTPNYIEPVKETPKRDFSGSNSEGGDDGRPNWDQPNRIKAVFETTDEIKSGTFFIDLEFESDGYKETMQLKINVLEFWLVCKDDSKYFTQDKIMYKIDLIPRKGFKGWCIPFFESLPKGITPVFSENPIFIDNKEKSFDVTLMFMPGMQGIFTPVLNVKNENGSSSWMLIARKGSYEIQVYPPEKGSYKLGAEVDWTIMIGSLSEKPVKLYCKISYVPKGWIVKHAINTLSEDNSFESAEIGKEKEITVEMSDNVFVSIRIVIPKDADMKNTTVRFEIRDGDNIRIEDLSKDYVIPDHNL